MAQVLVVTNRKGGSGKTTTAVNLAAEWAARGQRVLLVDLDAQGHCALGLGVSVKRGQPTVHSLLEQAEAPLATGVIPTQWPRLSLLPADTRFDGRSPALGHDRLRQQLVPLQGVYDRILIDTPPALDPWFNNGVGAADAVLIPFVPQVLGRAGVRQLAQLFYRIAATRSQRLRLAGLVPVMSDRNNPVHARILAETSRMFGPGRLFRGVRMDMRLAEAFGAQEPIRAFAPRSPGAMDYFVLAEQLDRDTTVGAAVGF